MTIYTDNRGYQYIGTPFVGNDLQATFGPGTTSTADRYSSNIAGSELGQMMENVLGTGNWAIAGSWSTGGANSILLGNGATIVCNLPNHASVRPSIDPTGWTLNQTLKMNSVPAGAGDFGAWIGSGTAGNSDDYAVINAGNTRVPLPSVINLSNGYSDNHDTFYASAGPSHFSYVSFQASAPTTPFWFYAGILQTATFAETEVSCLFTNVGFPNAASQRMEYRAVSAGSTSRIQIDRNDSVDPVGIANFPNTTGDPYIIRLYPIDLTGTFADKARGYAPDVYSINSAGGAVGSFIQAETGSVGGGYSGSGLLDGSNFTYLMKVAEWDGRGVYVRVGQV